jgi:hypothetical protein
MTESERQLAFVIQTLCQFPLDPSENCLFLFKVEQNLLLPWGVPVVSSQLF